MFQPKTTEHKLPHPIIQKFNSIDFKAVIGLLFSTINLVLIFFKS